MSERAAALDVELTNEYGGDGLVVAHLRIAQGDRAAVWVAHPDMPLPPDDVAQAMLDAAVPPRGHPAPEQQS